MLKSILNLNNVKKISKQQQEEIKASAGHQSICCKLNPYTHEIECAPGRPRPDGGCLWY